MPEAELDRMDMPKAEQAFLLLRRDILDARLAPGLALPVSLLKARYGLGWTPLREALSRLETERLVSFSPNRGYRVAGVSAAELLDLQKARKAVETSLLEEAIDAGDLEWEQRVVAAHHALKQAGPLRAMMPEAALAVWERHHRAFHRALLGGAGSLWLQRIAEQVNDHVDRHHRIMVLAQLTGAEPAAAAEIHAGILARASSLDHHTRLMEAALSRDKAAAVALLHEHIGFTLDAYDALQTRKSGAGAAG